MLLGEIKNYLSQKKTATLHEISIALKSDSVLVMQAMEIFERKGKIMKEILKAPCSRCSCCSSDSAECNPSMVLYRWEDGPGAKYN